MFVNFIHIFESREFLSYDAQFIIQPICDDRFGNVISVGQFYSHQTVKVTM